MVGGKLVRRECSAKKLLNVAKYYWMLKMVIKRKLYYKGLQNEKSKV